MKIEILDNIYCKVSKMDMAIIKPCLQYEAVAYKEVNVSKNPNKKFYKKVRKTYPKYMIEKQTYFLKGLLPRIIKFCDDKGIKVEIEEKYKEKIAVKINPELKGITFREDQIKAITSALRHKTGLIVAPTRTGKTIIALGIISCLDKNTKILFLCHTVDIIQQTYKEFIKYGYKEKDINLYKFDMNKRITISTIQTFSKIDYNEYMDFFDVTIIDEAHRCNSVDSQYGKVMTKNLSPVRLGFTATTHNEIKSKEKQLALEGLLGPIIHRVTIEEAQKLNIMLKPTIKLIPINYSDSIADNRTYKDLYQKGIVENRTRNFLLIKEVEKRTKENKSVLIIVKTIEHGEILLLEAKENKIKAKFINGSTNKNIRDDIKNSFEKKKIKAIIATIWKEGVNIPSLDCVINAGLGKADISILQAMGRSLTKDIGKKKAEIIDFLDPYRYLAEHTVERIKIYIESGWL